MQGALTRGFSLLELTIVIVLLGIMGASFGLIIVPAMRAYDAQTQRAALVDAGESALRRMARDIRIAVPYSARLSAVAGGGFALEVVPTVDGARFCAIDVADCGSNDANVLKVDTVDTDFDVLGVFTDTGFTGIPANYRVAVGNTGLEIYTDTASPAPITPAGKAISLSVAGTKHHIAIGSGGHRFCASTECSPRQRVFIIKKAEAPVAYVCSTSAGTLTRYWNYSFEASYTTGSSARVANGVDCNASGVDSTGLLSGVVTVTLKLRDTAGETVTLLHQVQMDNSQ